MDFVAWIPDLTICEQQWHRPECATAQSDQLFLILPLKVYKLKLNLRLIPLNMFKSSSVFPWLFQGGVSFVDHFYHLSLMLIFVMLFCLFLAAFWSPAGKGLTSWLSCVLCFLNMFLALFHMAFRIRCGTWLYRFLIFAFLSTIFTTLI